MNDNQFRKSYITSLYNRCFMYYKPHDKQKLFHKAGNKAKQRLFLAGNRTGKTYCGIIESVAHLTGYYPSWWEGKTFTRPIKAWASSVTSALTEEVLESGYLEVIAKDLLISINRQKHSYKIRHISGGESEITFKSYEQGRQKFQAAKLDLVHLDEEPPKDIYTECLMRTMSTDKNNTSIIILTMTPLLGLTNLIMQFQEREINKKIEHISENTVFDNKFYIQAEWNDNPHLLESEKNELVKSLSPHEREAREKGIPSLGSGLIYPVLHEGFVIQPIPIPHHWGRIYAMDFGWTNPTATLFAAYDRDNDTVYITGEYYVSERTPQQHATQLIRMGAGSCPGVCDPAGGQSSQKDGGDIISLYRQSGLTNLTIANNAKEEGIMKVLQRLQNGQLKIFSTMTNTLKEMGMYCRDKSGKPTKSNDHLMDCLRYLIMSGLPLSSNNQHMNRPNIRKRSGSFM